MISSMSSSHRPTMPRHLPLIAIATAAWGLCLAIVAWLAAVWLGRSLSFGELVLVGVLFLVAAVFIVQDRMQRDRRKMQDMRDSALW
jgi:membrane protein YdbS with pleckstrin-like domain